MQNTELKNLHLSMRYLENTKRQNSHRITWREKKVKSLLQRVYADYTDICKICKQALKEGLVAKIIFCKKYDLRNFFNHLTLLAALLELHWNL